MSVFYSKLSVLKIAIIFKTLDLDIKRFFNSSSMQYRELNIKDNLPNISFKECYELLYSNGMIAKRPSLITANKILYY